MTYEELAKTGLFQIRAPRYTSYPPATAFETARDDSVFRSQLAKLDPTEPLSIYVHIPFCERLCWFCACRTQGVRSLTPVQAYIETLLAEVALAADVMPEGMQMGRLHFGGGTPTIMSPDLITRVMSGIDDVFDRAVDFEFSVEIDPTLVNVDKIRCLADHGMTRASIGVQDFDSTVQAAIGREQSFAQTENCVADLRAAGVKSVNIDLVYGLAHQTTKTFEKTLNEAISLDPDRFSLFGYAHVPHMAKRQRLIAEQALPGDRGRFELFGKAAEAFKAANYVAVGIDHFAKPTDSLVKSLGEGRLKRNFQGYTADNCPSLLAFGASAISRIGGFFQNATRTADYRKIIATGNLPIARQHVWTADDRLRGRAIEMLLCDFKIDMRQLREDCGPLGDFAVDLMSSAAEFNDHVTLEGDVLRLKEASKPFVRVVAQYLDAYKETDAIYSRVS
ncbi:oxygen-independent coproporphyrinogen-3 oxidase [Cognatiyoonia koreensis]|uniref:Coproporphyrinogen-III oxidase n=1 Tax=Cognatiyoonia koreensis TaxID=364200 RepID=A0A1I0RQH3_9RHOB|nr:oxygen-independent coproporphyrinogen III oxidase [Cognatiyoonia koreensis]SEW42985.1 oxygen-independent coproporphyrinogen-3 oxidase [Cognatiyoonia koreensis]